MQLQQCHSGCQHALQCGAHVRKAGTAPANTSTIFDCAHTIVVGLAGLDDPMANQPKERMRSCSTVLTQ